MTHADLLALGKRWLKTPWGSRTNHNIYHGRCGIIAVDKMSQSGERPDLLGFYDAMSILVEVKISRSDFFRDRKKTWRQYSTGMGIHRLYLTPKGMLKPEEVPENYGLIEADELGNLEVVVEGDSFLPTYDAKSERAILLSLIRAEAKK